MFLRPGESKGGSRLSLVDSETPGSLASALPLRAPPGKCGQLEMQTEVAPTSNPGAPTAEPLTQQNSHDQPAARGAGGIEKPRMGAGAAAAYNSDREAKGLLVPGVTAERKLRPDPSPMARLGRAAP